MIPVSIASVSIASVSIASVSIAHPRIRYFRALAVLLLFAVQGVAGDAAPPVLRVRCAGDSITQRGYPAVLQEVLGSGYAVVNAGHSGVTALKHAGTRSYPDAGPKDDADIVVVMLGTNDTKVETWKEHQNEFVADYTQLISSFQRLPSKPKVYIALSPPIYKPESGSGFSAANQEVMIGKVRAIATTSGCPLIDVHAATLNHPEWFGDGVHPNDAGMAAIAKAIAAAIRSAP
jgi:lysophospholipase L1-like esterase